MTNETQSQTRKKIIAYDDDSYAINNRYVRMARDNDFQLVYFTRDGDEQTGKEELLREGIPQSLIDLTVVVDEDMIFELGMGNITAKESGIPFPQDADRYFIDGLNYNREEEKFGKVKMGKRGFIPIASRLPKDKVTILSLDHKACEDAKRLGYNVGR